MQQPHSQARAPGRLSEPSCATKDTDLPPLPIDAALGQRPTKVGSTPGLLRRFTTKLRSPVIPSTTSATKDAHSPPSSSLPNHRVPSSSNMGSSVADNGKPKRKATMRLPSMPRAPAPSALPNSFTSAEHRQAALRAMGLLPAVPHPYKDSHGYMIPLSEQERVLDSRFTVLAEQPEGCDDEQDSEAKKIREAWLARNSETQGAAPARRPSLADDDVTIGQETSPLRVEAHSARLAVPSGAGFDSSALGSVLGPPSDNFQDAALSALLESQLSEPGDIHPSTSPVSVSIGPSPRVAAVPHKDRPITAPSSPSSDATERVSRWLQLSSDAPKSSSSSVDHERASGSPQPPEDSRGGARSLAKGRKEKLAPVIVTISPDSDGPSVELHPPASAPAHFSTSVSFEFDEIAAAYALRPLPTPPRGRSVTVSHVSRSGADNSPAETAKAGVSEMSLDRRSNHLPALSPTRTTSSSDASISVTTPTTTSHSLESRGHHTRPRRHRNSLTVPELGARLDEDAGAVIAESSVEDDSSGFTGDGWEAVSMSSPGISGYEGKRAVTLGIFSRKSDGTARSPRPSNSMLNLRRSVTQKLQLRPKSVVSPSTPANPQSANPPPSAFPASWKPSSPSAMSDNSSTISDRSRTVGAGLRAREPLAPTMHSRETMLREAGRIQDEESRRLSEMAFLDC
ncbi:hypothetical protein B0H21DRAFT_826328 [Amylocystis lapponica]|nr:hypothetical protein B0H21DRAFT_826328 [Amylocystis lapponica]